MTRHWYGLQNHGTISLAHVPHDRPTLHVFLSPTQRATWVALGNQCRLMPGWRAAIWATHPRALKYHRTAKLYGDFSNDSTIIHTATE